MDRGADALDLRLSRLDPFVHCSCAGVAVADHRRGQPPLRVADRIQCTVKRQPVEKERVESVVTDALDSHICRCTGYVRYHRAVRELILATPGLTKESGHGK